MFGIVLTACGTQSAAAPTTVVVPTVAIPPTTIPPTAIPPTAIAPTTILPTTIPPTAVADSTAAADATQDAVAGSTDAADSSQDIARPSNPGGPGPAVSLTGDPKAGALVFANNCKVCHGDAGKGGVSNPGSTDGTVPSLNPIDDTLVSKDPKTYASNLDLFIEHGSTPEGTKPSLIMPPWGDKKDLTPQQIADVIAYIISLNPPK